MLSLDSFTNYNATSYIATATETMTLKIIYSK